MEAMSVETRLKAAKLLVDNQAISVFVSLLASAVDEPLKAVAIKAINLLSSP